MSKARHLTPPLWPPPAWPRSVIQPSSKSPIPELCLYWLKFQSLQRVIWSENLRRGMHGCKRSKRKPPPVFNDFHGDNSHPPTYTHTKLHNI
jgi:hypothetical protein